MALLNKLVDKGNTVIIIEHNLEVMKMADYIIDIGPNGGKFGGQVVYSGTVKKMLETSNTITAQCLRNNVEHKTLSEAQMEELIKAIDVDDKVDVYKPVIEEEEGMRLNPIGYVNAYNGNYEITIAEKYREALKGLDGFSHLQIVFWFSGCDNEIDRNILVNEKPYKKGPEELGTFATRSPERPNPIGISVSEVNKIDYEKGVISLAYIDAFTGTPVLDIKPYTPSVDKVNNVKTPAWCAHWPKSYEESGDFNWEAEFNFDMNEK